MRIDTDIVFDDFKNLSHIDTSFVHSVSMIFKLMESGSREDGNKNFGFFKAGQWTTYQKNRYSRIEIFIKKIIETGNIKYAKKISGIGWQLGWTYINYLNNEAVDRGLPPIFKKQIQHSFKRKLSDKQVAYIKYLCTTKYSAYEIAKMYNVSPSTIYLIKVGMLYKSVFPVIIEKLDYRPLSWEII